MCGRYSHWEEDHQVSYNFPRLMNRFFLDGAVG